MSTRRGDAMEAGQVYAAPYQTAWGTGWVYVREGRLVGVDLPGEGPENVPGGAPTAADADDAEALVFWAEGMEGYFAGERVRWTPAEVSLVGLDLGDFERTVYETLMAIPVGETVSYGKLAEMAGYPRAARAVGNAMAANPIPIVVPCHRVIRADGTLGRYGNDPAWKERLLTHERRYARGEDGGFGVEEGS